MSSTDASFLTSVGAAASSGGLLNKAAARLLLRDKGPARVVFLFDRTLNLSKASLDKGSPLPGN